MILSFANITSELKTEIKRLNERGVRKLLLVAYCWLMVAGTIASGQTNYYSKSVGNLNVPDTWGLNPDGTGSSPGNFNTSNRIFNIRNNAAPTISGDWTVSGAGSRVIIGDDTTVCVFTVPDHRDFTATTDISNNGILKIISTADTPYSGTLTVQSGGTYEHAVNGGTIPTATWNASSNCNITGVTVNEPGGLNQSFGNFTWNCAVQTGTELNINSLSESFSGAVTGDFTLLSTGTGSVRFANITPRVLAISGDFNISGGTLILAIETGSGTVKIGGDFNMTGGTIIETGSSSGLFVFDNAGTTQNFRRTAGSISNRIGFTVDPNVTVDFGPSDYANGGGTFTLSNGATLQTANSTGVNGSIQTTSRSLSTSANYTFDGTAAQVTGTYLPAIVNNFTINNVTGITLTDSVIATSNLYMNSGNINTGANTFILSNPVSSALNYTAGVISGRFERFINTTSVNYFFPVGATSQIQSVTANFVNLTAGSLLVRYIAGDPGNSGLPLTDEDGSRVTNQFTSGYWSVLAKNSLASTNYSIDLNATGFVTYTINAGTRLIKRTDTGGSWFLNGTHSDAVGSVVRRTGMSGISNAGGGTQFGIGRSGPGILTQPSDHTICGNAGTGFSVIASGHPTLSYQWYKVPGIPLIEGGRFTGTNMDTVNISNIVSGDAGSYYCIVTDGPGNTVQSTSASLTVNALPIPTFTVQPGATACSATNVTYTTQTGQTSYVWTFTGVSGTDYSITSGGTATDNTVTVKWLTSGSKTVTIRYTSAGGCTAATATTSSATMVTLLPKPTIKGPTPVCAGVAGNVYTTEAGMSNYIWTISAGGTITAGGGIGNNTVTVTWTTTEAKTVTINYTNAGGCTGTTTTTVTVDKNPIAIAGPDQELTFIFETQMNSELSLSETGEWSLVSGSGHLSDIHSPATMVTELSTGENIFLWKVQNGSCEASAEVKITVHDLFVPSVITPDGDGKNDYFKISENIGKVELIIFNRWGNEEYTNGDYKNDWDGRNNKGAELPFDTYFYVLKFENGKLKKGSVLIKR